MKGGGHYCRLILLSLVVGGLLGCLYGWVLALAETKKYESTVVVEIKLKGLSEGASGQHRFVNELEILTAVETLRQLDWDLGLQEKWGRDGDSVISLLQEAIASEEREGTNLVELSVSHIDPETALSLARGLPEAYMGRKNFLQQTAFEDRMSELKPLLRNRLDEEEENYGVLMQVSEELEIPFLRDEGLMKEAHRRLVEEYPKDELLNFASKMERFEEARENYEKSAEGANKLELVIKEEVFRSLEVPASLLIHEQPSFAAEAKKIEGLGKKISIAGGWGLFWGAVAGAFLVALSASKSKAAAGALSEEPTKGGEIAPDIW